MQKRRLAALFLAIAVAVVLPTLALAAVNPTGAGLVPCGVSSDPLVATQCEACNGVQLLQNIIMFLIGIAIPLTVAMFAYAGFLYFSSGIGGTENLGKARKIFSSTLFGFALAVAAWLIVNTILFTVLDKNQYPNSSWFRIDCTTLVRQVNTDIGTVIAGHLGVAPTVIQQPPSIVATCPPGYKYEEIGYNENACVSADGKTTVAPTVTYDNPNVSKAGGSCKSFTSNSLMACVAAFESSCNPAIGSGVDIGSDGKPVSWGLWQINISANPIKCSASGGQTINCPSAFGGGAYTSKNRATFVRDKALFDKCVQLAQNPTCNYEVATNLLNSAGGKITPWGMAARNNCQ